MKKLLTLGLCLLVSLGLSLPFAFPQAGEKDDPKTQKPSLGDKDDASIQNKRFLKIRNETTDKLNVYVQFRTLDNGAWTWVPSDPAKGAEAISFEVEAGAELAVQHKDEPLAASRMRIWGSSPTQKWLQYKTKDIWLVPERNDEGEHVYLAPGIEPFIFVFSNSKDKGVIAGDSDVFGEQILPTEGENLPPPVPEIPWDVLPDPLPPDFPIIRDLAVLPIYTTGSNAMVRVKNLGHFSANVGRRLIVQKVAQGSFPEDKGLIGPLFHFSVKSFYLVGMAPGNYVAFITPGDEIPYQLNDKKGFTITAMKYSDAAVLPVTVLGGKAWIKVKNVGTDDLADGRIVKLKKMPMGPTTDLGPIGPLGVNAVKAFPGAMLAAGNYVAFVAPGDAPPYHLNDAKPFAVAAATLADFDVLPITVGAGKATFKIKNIGTANAPAGNILKVQKLPGGAPSDVGPIGLLMPGTTKTFAGVPFAPGNYKAFVSPGDAPPHHANDSELFAVPSIPDLEANTPFKAGAKVKAVIHCHGPGDYAGGTRTWRLEKFSAGMWVSIPPAGPHIIGPIANGAGLTVEGNFTGPGTYRLRISSGDSSPANDTKSKALP